MGEEHHQADGYGIAGGGLPTGSQTTPGKPSSTLPDLGSDKESNVES